MMNGAEKEGIARIVGDPAAETRVSTPPPPPLLQACRLHNFSFPTLIWGGQRLLRCSKLPDPAARHWSLRTRSAACNAPAVGRPGINGSCYKALVVKKADPPRNVVRLRSDESKKGEMTKFSISSVSCGD
ncbi:unnamed protein product [Musa acuminata var. zebrina]